ncbi:MAG TPA: ABC transporter permease subunit, partial [Anaerolineae bacterium]|nr:ABC transporter permease subunit [Anaerolineae bacterium]
DPAGRDMMSLILGGAQQTFVLAFSVVALRLLIGSFLGALAGWFQNSWIDRALMGFIQALTVYPTLLLTALIIFLSPTRTLPTFIIALSIAGWTEIMQFVRGEVISIKAKPYIESALALGQRTSRIVLKHILPNIAPAMMALAALEASAVLLVLGELGFLGIFISGNASADSSFGLFAQLPEWGSLLSGVRNWARTWPEVGIFPTSAFFIAILGFNLFSEGLRRFVEEVGLAFNRLLNKYTIGALSVAVFGIFWLQDNSGNLVYYRQQASTYNGANVSQYLQDIVDPQFEGRALNSDGLNQTADYIAQQFSDLGLQPAGQQFTYFQDDTRRYQELTAPPTFLVNGESSYTYRNDYAVYPTLQTNLGRAEGLVRMLTLGPNADISNLDLSNQIILLFDETDLVELADHNCAAVLIATTNLSQLKQRRTYSADPATGGCGQSTPAFWINERIASQLVAERGLSLNDLKQEINDLGNGALADFTTTQTVTLEIIGEIREVAVKNVIGHLPGTNDAVDENVIMVLVQYDMPPTNFESEGTDTMGANDNASGLAVMLEAIRTLQESGYEPYKTFLFIAYSGEGLPDQQLAPDPRSYLTAKTGFTRFNIQGVVYLRGLAGAGERHVIWTDQANEFTKTIETASDLLVRNPRKRNDHPAMNLFTSPQAPRNSDQDIPQVGFSREGWEVKARLSGDTLTFVNNENLATSGQALTLGLMIVGQ